MADTQYALYSYSLIDELGTKTSMNVPAMVDPTTGTPTALAAAWTGLGTQIDNASGAQILGGTVAIVLKPDGGWKSSPDSGSRVEQTGLFNFVNTTSKYKFGIDLPSIINTALVGGKIDLTNTAIADLVSFLLATFTGGRFATTSTFFLSALVDAIISFRKRRKSLSRTSFEEA